MHFRDPTIQQNCILDTPYPIYFFLPPPPYTNNDQNLVNNGQNLVNNGQNLTLPSIKSVKNGQNLTPSYTKMAEI